MNDTTALAPDRLAEIRASVERAHTEIGQVCAEGPHHRFRMSVPAQPGRDTDLIISDALKGAGELLAEVEKLHAQRDRLLALHEYDELIFGGFICVHCTPNDADDPDDNIAWPCPSLRAIGVDNDEGNAIILARRAAIARKAAQEAGAR
ncbi:hypothetical protein [Nonomuraea sp. SBT364]|uniref:hypothetical protein n=1 Tax=Nonomuraea sp. SBT364 TaxID=1580530 RepID=UPI00066DE4E0|nr:hypothetical protein [Nonomuraea sp. SBT364]